MNSVEVYDPDVNQWTTLAAMRSRRSGVSCIAYHNKVFRYIASYSFDKKEVCIGRMALVSEFLCRLKCARGYENVDT